MGFAKVLDLGHNFPARGPPMAVNFLPYDLSAAMNFLNRRKGKLLYPAQPPMGVPPPPARFFLFFFGGGGGGVDWWFPDPLNPGPTWNFPPPSNPTFWFP